MLINRNGDRLFVPLEYYCILSVPVTVVPRLVGIVTCGYCVRTPTVFLRLLLCARTATVYFCAAAVYLRTAIVTYDYCVCTPTAFLRLLLCARTATVYFRGAAVYLRTATVYFRAAAVYLRTATVYFRAAAVYLCTATVYCLPRLRVLRTYYNYYCIIIRSGQYCSTD